MEYAISKLPKSEVEIKVTVPEEKMHEYRKKAADEISKEVKVKGFRPGHVPPHVLEEYVDKKYIEAHAAEAAIQDTYRDVVMKEKIQILTRPKVKIESENPLVYTATVATTPEAKLENHSSIKVKKDEVKVTDAEIDDVLKDLQNYGTRYKDVDRAAQMGDRVEVDFEGFDGDKPVANTKSSNHPVILGGNSLIPGFEEELVGLKKDEKKEFKITFPKDYGKKELQGKELTFKVEMKRIEEPDKPEINEDYIEKMTGKKTTVEDFRKEIAENIRAKKEEEARRKQENEYIEELLKKVKIDLSDMLIDEESDAIYEDMKSEIEGKGHEWEKFLERGKTTADELRTKYRGEAERRLKIRFALQELLKLEDVKIEDSEIDDELKKILAMYPQDQHEAINNEFSSGHLKSQLKNKLSLDKLFAKVLA